MLQSIDQGIVLALNAYATKSAVFDRVISSMAAVHTLKVFPIVIALVWVWFKAARHHTAIIKGVVGAILVLGVSRLIQNLSPHRPRPMNDEHLGFVLPTGIAPEKRLEWSSFPSDTTALAFALAAVVWCGSRPLGWLCFLWATVMVALPRIYTGLHYPSDIVGGAILGLLLTLACVRIIPDVSIESTALRTERKRPWIFYSIAFVLLFYIVTFFEDIRHLAQGAADVLQL